MSRIARRPRSVYRVYDEDEFLGGAGAVAAPSVAGSRPLLRRAVPLACCLVAAAIVAWLAASRSEGTAGGHRAASTPRSSPRSAAGPSSHTAPTLTVARPRDLRARPRAAAARYTWPRRSPSLARSHRRGRGAAPRRLVSRAPTIRPATAAQSAAELVPRPARPPVTLTAGAPTTADRSSPPSRPGRVGVAPSPGVSPAAQFGFEQGER